MQNYFQSGCLYRHRNGPVMLVCGFVSSAMHGTVLVGELDGVFVIKTEKQLKNADLDWTKIVHTENPKVQTDARQIYERQDYAI